MKAVLALATFALITLLMEEKARELTGDARHAYGEAANQARATRDTVAHKIEAQPIMAATVATVVGYVLAKIARRI